jgi:CelD/BcsL family acetyltransferase involved in cellulose biosynthesis/RimJ/RimL family protein N-acetyltransferase
MSVQNVDVVCGEAAQSLLISPQFIQHWNALHASCLHATAFQGPGFVRAWYASYRAQWQPVIVRSVDAEGVLDGLWLLAYAPADGRLVNAGAHQAEYHTWLCSPETDRCFLTAGWALLKSQIAFSTLHFKYLPDPVLGDILVDALGLDGRVALRRCARPLLKLDADQVKASAAKKSNKSRFNRLGKLGKFEFRRITELDEFDRITDDLVAFYDLRQGAVNQSTPFREDPEKRAFHRKLFAEAPNDVYCTATFIDDRPIAAFWGAVSGNTVHLGLLISSPFCAEHSPGKIHIMQLCEQLLNDDHNVFDLTPGGDPWKERFANGHDEVAEAAVYCSAMTRRRDQLVARVAHWGKTTLALARITPGQVRATLATLRRAKPAAVARKLGNWYGEHREFRVYRADRALASRFDLDPRVQCNHLPDLLAFEPSESWQSRDVFLSNALARIEQGDKAFTVSSRGRLTHSGWMGMNQLTSHMSEVGQTMTFPPHSVALYDFYSHPEFRGAGLYRATIGHMLKAAFSADATEYAYISVLADNGPSRHVIETMGFKYQASYFWESRFGKERKWPSATMASPEVVSA